MNIHFPEYQSYLHAEIRGGVMQGYLFSKPRAADEVASALSGLS